MNARIDQDRPKLRSHAIGFLAVNTLLQGSLRDENGDQWRKFKGVSPVSRRRGARGQRNAKVAGAFRAALPLSSRGGWVSVPATAEPMIACIIAGSAEFQEREIGGAWLPRRVRRGDLFVTRSKAPYELRWNSALGAELEVVHIHLAVDQLTAALETVYQDNAAAVEVTEFFGRDETLAHLSFACAEMLSGRTAGNARRIAAFAHLLAIHIAEKCTNVASQRPDYRGGLRIVRLRKIEDYVRAHLAESILIETLAELAELSPFHFSRVFKQATGLTPLQFVRAHVASAATDPRNIPQPDRNRARSRLY